MPIARIFFTDFAKPKEIDEINQLQVSRQNSTKQLDTPFLKSLWKDSMVGI